MKVASAEPLVGRASDTSLTDRLGSGWAPENTVPVAETSAALLPAEGALRFSRTVLVAPDAGFLSTCTVTAWLGVVSVKVIRVGGTGV